MATKKNIFEKLGLVEPVEEEVVDFSELDDFVPAPVEVDGEEEVQKIEEKLDVLIESYERDKLMTVDDVYRKANLVRDIKESVFMVDILMKALPENLPSDIKRESVSNIMKAAEMKVEDLLNDAYQRIDALNNVLEQTVQVTEQVNAKNEGTIRELEKRIDELRRDIQSRLKFQESQNSALEYEIQKVINIVEFIKGKK